MMLSNHHILQRFVKKKNARQITLQLKYVKLMNTIIIHAEYLANTQELVDMLINMLGGCKILT